MLAAEIALFLGVFIKFDGAIIFVSRFEHYTLYQNLATILPVLDLTGVLFTETYTGILRRTKYQEALATIWHSVVNFFGVLLYMQAMKATYFYSRLALALFGLFMIMISYTFRCSWKRVIRHKMILDVNKTSLIVVSESDVVEECLGDIALTPYMEFKVKGVAVLDKDMMGQRIMGVPVIATADSVFEYLRTNVVDEVFLDGKTNAGHKDLARRFVEQGLTVHVALIHTDNLMPNKIMETYGRYVVLTSSMHITNNRQAFIKRVSDIAGALVGLVFALIAFIIFAPIIKIQSPGPVFFTQTRIGKNGRKFKFYKFRSMYMDAEARKQELMAQNEVQGNMFKMENDPRVFPIGRFMRKYSIDELPQFWNVLKGDMSLVGTRPPLEDEYENYALHHKARLSIKPGLTGMWQVSGRSDVKDFEQVVALDTDYIANWSLGLDIRILLKTVAVVLGGKGSK
ncbi:sugar transferase [Pseudobutyrivibrio xylanivorans]|uniref:Sugar transferase n=2 Tax=Pseudobutyrivibrio xylanivorans TaxID=185007 RepID=A0A5P6VUJ0_PSEXY|nr:sugar transferase [Pseudobutyrivibrio xylanivorans]